MGGKEPIFLLGLHNFDSGSHSFILPLYDHLESLGGLKRVRGVIFDMVPGISLKRRIRFGNLCLRTLPWWVNGCIG